MALTIGEAAPWFVAATPSNPEYVFDTVAGRYVFLVFLPKDPVRRSQALQVAASQQALFDDAKIACFLVAREAESIAQARDMRGLRWFLDPEDRIGGAYQAVGDDGAEHLTWVLLDPTLRILAYAPLEQSDAMIRRLQTLPPVGDHAGVALHAPVMVAPRIFDPDLCRRLIALHEAQGGAFTGVMRDEGDRTVAVMDELKKRKDVIVEEPDLKAEIRDALERRLFPEIAKVFQYKATEIERYLVGCYDVADGGVFHPHRDDTTHGTAHRKFAGSINLNDDFDGGDLRFAEYGPTTYRPPVGGALVFACGLLHQVTPVTRGRRYAFLPFFFDDAGRKVRQAYEQSVAAPAP